MVTTTDLASYLSLNPDYTEDLTGFLSAAKSFAKTAGIPSFSYNALYDEFIKALAGYFHDNKSLSVDEGARKIIDSYVLMLRYAEEDPVEEPAEEPAPDGGDTA